MDSKRGKEKRWMDREVWRPVKEMHREKQKMDG